MAGDEPAVADTSAPGDLMTAFGPLTIRYGPDSFTPRAWTEHQARWAAQAAVGLPPGPILELGAGVGHIGLLAARLTGRRLVQADADADALRWARVNAVHAGLAGVVETRTAAAEDAARPGERFALIIADPPYVPSDEVAGEDGPDRAVDGGPDGLEHVRRWVSVAADHLESDGLVSLQIGGAEQAEAFLAWLDRSGIGLRPVGLRTFGPDRAVVHLGPRVPGPEPG